ncbi:hypothetical protein H6A66_16045 [Bacteroides caecigallinarum]|uniref:hypothetical protein n=1 Tax=Bacteroides caecigallinarum TaxID=1411144 RepID=UPI001958C0B4|nr:hypothetical protein [Bacteroides caecigallinarum]MBM6866654.1 hypothetical protein [Bacteroides caecigallinarum]
MKQTIDGYEFDFPEALELYKFDNDDNLAGEKRHGVDYMKAVDVMAEFKKCYLWIEIKEYMAEEIEEMKKEPERKTKEGKHIKNYLRNNLVRKFRDTFLYRYCENKLDKPIFYICLMNFDDAMLMAFRKELRLQIPEGNKRQGRWEKCLLDKGHLILVNEDSWNRNLNDKFGSCRKV